HDLSHPIIAVARNDQTGLANGKQDINLLLHQSLRQSLTTHQMTNPHCTAGIDAEQYFHFAKTYSISNQSSGVPLAKSCLATRPCTLCQCLGAKPKAGRTIRKLCGPKVSPALISALT